MPPGDRVIIPGRESRWRLMTPMKDIRLLTRNRPAMAMASVMALILAGCGGAPSAPAEKGQGSPAQVSSAPTAVSQKSASKSRLKGTTPEGELGVRERRSQKL